MTCAACATRIEKGLKKMEGVEEANVNLALEKAMVKYDPTSKIKYRYSKENWGSWL